MAEPNLPVRREVRYTGRVQGVGFRYTTCRIATRYPVVGIVENLADDSVRLIVEGRPQPVAQFLADLAETMGHSIEQTTVTGSRPASLPAS